MTWRPGRAAERVGRRAGWVDAHRQAQACSECLGRRLDVARIEGIGRCLPLFRQARELAQQAGLAEPARPVHVQDEKR